MKITYTTNKTLQMLNFHNNIYVKCFDVLVVGHLICGSGFYVYYLSLLGINTVYEVDGDYLKWTKYQGLS